MVIATQICPTTNSMWHHAKNRILGLILALILSGWLLIALIDPANWRPWLIGFLLGTILGHVSLAAGWCALGPLGLTRRMPLALAWVATVVIAFAVNMARDPASGNLFDLLLDGGALLTQFALTQAPFWPLVALYGVRIRHHDQCATVAEWSDHQFGTRQLMILTAIVAVVLGSGRLALGGLAWDERGNDWRDILFWGFIAICSSAISFPLIAAALLNRKATLPICGAIGLAIIVTVFELPLLSIIMPGSTGWHDYVVFICMNVFQCAWILSVLVLLRSSGYRLVWRGDSLFASSAT